MSAKRPTLIKQQPWRRQGLATIEQWWLLGRTQIRIVLKIPLNHGFSIFIYNKKQLSTSAVLQLYSVDPVITEGLISSIFVLSSQVYLIMLFCPLLPWYIGCSNIGNRDTGPSFKVARFVIQETELCFHSLVTFSHWFSVNIKNISVKFRKKMHGHLKSFKMLLHLISTACWSLHVCVFKCVAKGCAL